jgi:hypothetical protein
VRTDNLDACREQPFTGLRGQGGRLSADGHIVDEEARVHVLVPRRRFQNVSFAMSTGQLVCPRSPRSRTQGGPERWGATHRSAQAQRHKLFRGPGHAWTIISLRFEHPARPGPPEARKSMAEVQPNKGHDRGGGLRGPPVVMRVAAAGRCLVPAAPRGSEQNGRYPGRAIQ